MAGGHRTTTAQIDNATPWTTKALSRVDAEAPTRSGVPMNSSHPIVNASAGWPRFGGTAPSAPTSAPHVSGIHPLVKRAVSAPAKSAATQHAAAKAKAHPFGAHPIQLPGAVSPSRSFLARHKWTASGMAAVFVVAAAGISAAFLVREDIATTPSAVVPDVKFETGTDYATINTAGFATLTIGSSGASATLSLNGVAGAALTSLTSLAKVHNTDSVAYTIGFARSTTLNAAITDFTVTVKNGGTTILTWNAVSAATSSTFSLPATTTYDINIQLAVADGTAAGALGSFTMQVSVT